VKPQDKIQLVSGLLDLPILDKDYRYCGIVDDLEFEEADGALRVKALLVGPGAYRGRLPGWAFRLVGWIAGKRIARGPWDAIAEIGSAVGRDCRDRQRGRARRVRGNMRSAQYGR